MARCMTPPDPDRELDALRLACRRLGVSVTTTPNGDDEYFASLKPGPRETVLYDVTIAHAGGTHSGEIYDLPAGFVGDRDMAALRGLLLLAALSTHPGGESIDAGKAGQADDLADELMEALDGIYLDLVHVALNLPGEVQRPDSHDAWVHRAVNARRAGEGRPPVKLTTAFVRIDVGYRDDRVEPAGRCDA